MATNPLVTFVTQLASKVDPFGPCHIVVEDLNTDDENIDYCLNSDEEKSADDVAFLTCMKSLTPEERDLALALHDGRSELEE